MMIPSFRENVASILESALPITIQKVVIAQNVLLIQRKESSCFALKVRIPE
jgi:hypothetical protein